MRRLSKYKKVIIAFIIIALLQMSSFSTIISLSAESKAENKVENKTTQSNTVVEDNTQNKTTSENKTTENKVENKKEETEKNEVKVNTYQEDEQNSNEENGISTIATTQLIANGDYVIRSAANSKFSLNVAGASKNDGANVLLYQHEGYDHEKFTVTYLGNGDYSIVALHSGKSLDVTASGKANGTNVEQYSLNKPASNNQKWKIIKNSDGTYSLMSECNNLYLDISGGVIANNSNVQMYGGNGTIAQKFTFDPVKKETQLIKDGTYVIKTAMDNRYSLNVAGASMNKGANVVLYKYESLNHEKFKITHLGNNYYSIVALHSGMSLDVTANGKANGTNVEQYTLNKPASNNQKWKIIDNKDGTYSIMSACNNLYLDVSGGVAENNRNIQMYEGNGTIAQKFKIETPEVSDEHLKNENGKTINDGVYQIQIGTSSDFVLNVEGGSKNNSADVHTFRRQSAIRERFRVEFLYDGTGTYSITAECSGKVLDIENGSVKNGTNVSQYTKYTPITDNQRWIIQDAGGGYYNIISYKDKRYCLDVYGGFAYDENKVQIWEKNNANSQKFKFITPKDDVSKINTSKYPGYKEKIVSLMNAHPGWNFELLETGLKFSDVIAGETAVHSRNLVPNTSREDYICPTCDRKAYDNGSWYCASAKAVADYMDPRRFLDEKKVYQFLDVNAYSESSISIEGIRNKVNGTFLQSYTNDINNACRNKAVNPYFIIARLIQENGTQGSATSRPMNGGDGRHYFNPFNIGATGNTKDEIIYNAMDYAKQQGWYTMQKALEGGIQICKDNWLSNFQNTLYQNKFDIDTRNGTALYEHQYMQNLMAAESEASTLRGMYEKTGKIDANVTFIIPMYEGIDNVRY